MDYTLYEYSLGTALVLMLFFATYFLVAKTPDKPIFSNYLRSRRIMGVALLALSANYAVHLFSGLRFSYPGRAILINLSTYFLSYWLFSSALTALLDRFYLTRKRFLRHIHLHGEGRLFALQMEKTRCLIKREVRSYKNRDKQSFRKIVFPDSLRNEILFVFLLLHFKNAVMFCDRSTDKGHPYATTVWGSSGVPSSRTEAFSVPPPSPVAVSHSGTPSSKKRADYLAVWKKCVNTHTHTHS